MGSDRRTVIADAIIETLAAEGSRGLTHRAVDVTAGLPRGSTSYYLRTRAALLAAAVQRLAELDAAAIQPLRSEPAADLLSRVLEELLSSARTRLLARYELSLEAVRRPELRVLLGQGRSHVRNAVVAQLLAAGSADPHRVADDVLAMLEGLLFTEITAVEERARSRREMRQAIERVLE